MQCVEQHLNIEYKRVLHMATTGNDPKTLHAVVLTQYEYKQVMYQEIWHSNCKVDLVNEQDSITDTTAYKPRRAGIRRMTSKSNKEFWLNVVSFEWRND